MKKNMATKADIHEIAVDMAEFFHNTWVKMDETNERVTIIEYHLDMPHLKENSSHFQNDLVRFLISYAEHFLLCDPSLLTFTLNMEYNDAKLRFNCS